MNLSGLYVSEQQFDALARVFPDITSFTFKNTSLTKAQIEKFSKFSYLKTLDLTCDKDPWLTDALIVSFPEKLAMLLIGGQKKVTGSTFEALSKNILRLVASNCSLIDEAIEKLKDHERLIILEVQDNPKITQVNGPKNLKLLRAGNTSITDEAVKHFPDSIQTLNLDGCKKLTKNVRSILSPNLKSIILPEGI